VKKVLLSILVLLTLLLGTDTKPPYDKFSVLEDEIRSLKLKNKELETQNNNHKEQMKKYKNALVAKKLKRAKLKLAQASINTIIPLASTTSIVALTYNDIRDYCQDVQEFKALEASMFGTFDHEVTEDEKRLCKYDMQEELLPAIDQYPQDSKEWIKDKYKKIEDKTKQKIDKWF
jgi:hypothetical protein